MCVRERKIQADRQTERVREGETGKDFCEKEPQEWRSNPSQLDTSC